MQTTIRTTYTGPTNSRGSRVTATTTGGRASVVYDHALNAEDNHKAAMEALCLKLRIKPLRFAGGSGPYCFWSEAA